LKDFLSPARSSRYFDVFSISRRDNSAKFTAETTLTAFPIDVDNLTPVVITPPKVLKNDYRALFFKVK
jgi:hypothetical protein